MEDLSDQFDGTHISAVHVTGATAPPRRWDLRKGVHKLYFTLFIVSMRIIYWKIP